MKELNIFTAADSNYITGALVTCLSILLHAKNTVSIHLHFIHSGVNEHELKTFADELRPFMGDVHSLDFVNLDSKIIDGFHIHNQHLTRMAYARLFIPSLFPDMDRAVYFDSDIIVRLPVDELAELDLEGNYVAAVQDINECTSLKGCYDKKLFSELGLDLNTPYLNSGFLVMDLKAWRENGLEAKGMDFLNSYGNRLNQEDQSVINFLVHKNWKQMPKAWNFMVVLHENKARFVHSSVVNYHTVSHNKPWRYEKEGPCEIIRLFYSYLDRTNWQKHHKSDTMFKCRWPFYCIVLRRLRYKVSDIIFEAVYALTGKRFYRRA